MIALPEKPATKPTVAVFGAGGHTGRFIVSELQRRGIAPIAVARNETKLAELGFAERGIEIRAASVDDPASLDRAFDGAAAVINCAGPFSDTTDAVVSAALRAKIHYLDVSAEQPSAKAVYRKFDGPAREASILVIPAMGFYGGFADLLVSATMADWRAADDIRIGIALDSWLPTKGTRLTGEKNTAQRMVISGGRTSPLPQPAPATVWDFSEPFARQEMVELPFSEIVVIGRHTQTAELHTYLNRSAISDVRDPATPPPEPADETGRSAQIFLVEAVVRKGAHIRKMSARGRDIYAFSAPLVCEAVERILNGRASGAGAQPPGAIFDAHDFLGALTPNLTLARG